MQGSSGGSKPSEINQCPYHGVSERKCDVELCFKRAVDAVLMIVQNSGHKRVHDVSQHHVCRTLQSHEHRRQVERQYPQRPHRRCAFPFARGQGSSAILTTLHGIRLLLRGSTLPFSVLKRNILKKIPLLGTAAYATLVFPILYCSCLCVEQLALWFSLRLSYSTVSSH